MKLLFTSRSLELHPNNLTNFSFDRSINLTAVLCLCYKSIVRVNRSENLTNFYLISEVTRLGDATLMLGRHNYDVGETQLRCWGDTARGLGDVTWGDKAMG